MITKSAPTAVKARIMIVDDEEGMARILAKSLALEGYDARPFTDPRKALGVIGSEQPDLILTDVRMPGLSGHELLRRIKIDYPDLPVLIMTAFGTVEDAVDALRAGAFNYITKPFQHDHLLHQIALALRQRRLEQENVRLSGLASTEGPSRPMVGRSPAIESVRAIIRRAAEADIPVLITGESGVGKELVAREIHERSARGAARFVALNCPAIPESLIESEMFGFERGAFTGADQAKMGLIELSAGGTLFLDEIGELPVNLQAKLLRVLQEKEIQRLGGLKPIPVDLRVVAATNRNLEEEIESGKFRSDLFYRLNVLRVVVPPLRDRREDIPELATFFLDRIGRKFNRPGLRLDPDVSRALANYRWPGNIRELENVLERMAILARGDTLTAADLPAELRAGHAPTDSAGGPDARAWPENYREARDAFERAYLTRLLEASGGSVGRAARISGISRRSLYEKLDKHGIKRDTDTQAGDS
jgi:DNA-binding NtrC family response regulator